MTEEVKDNRIQSEDELAKKLYKLRMLNAELANNDARRQKELEETEAWYQPETKRINDEIAKTNELIDDYARRQLEENPWWKYAGRNGKVSKHKATTWNYDKGEIIQRGVPDEFIKVKKDLDWSEYKKSLTELDDGRLVDSNGELVTDITVTHSMNITIKPTEG